MSKVRVDRLEDLNGDVGVNVNELVERILSNLGAKSTAPTLRNNGSALKVGDRYFNTTDNYYYTRKSNNWIKDAAGGANSDITSLIGLTTPLDVSQGGTGANTKSGARTALDLKSAALADIVGTCAQVNGVPTGSILETGTTGNGTYIKYADGTMISYVKSIPLTFFNSANLQANWTFPISFIGKPIVMAIPFGALINFSSAAYSSITRETSSESGTTTTIFLSSNNAYTSGMSSLVNIIATGRWY